MLTFFFSFVLLSNKNQWLKFKAWEDEYKRSWDMLQEDEKGSLQGVVSSIQHTKRRRFFLIL